MNKSDMVVITLKMKNGTDVLGYYTGELTEDQTPDPALVLYRPIKIKQNSIVTPNGVTITYVPQFLFPYGDVITPIPHSEISHHEKANGFFTRFYAKALGELLVFEEDEQTRLTKAFDRTDWEEILAGTDSLLIYQNTTYLQ